MTQIVDLKREVKTRQRTGVAVAAAVVLVVLTGAFFATTQLLGSDDTSLPADRPPTRIDRAQQVATDFFAAYDDYDADGMLTLLAKNAVSPEWGSVAGLRGDVAFRTATGWTELREPCTASDESGGAVNLRCGYSLHALGSERLGRGPFGSAYWALHVKNGKITYAQSQFPYGTNEFSTTMWEPLMAFVQDEYPDDYGVMYEDEGTDGATSAGALQLWEQHIADYVAAVQAGTAD